VCCSSTSACNMSNSSGLSAGHHADLLAGPAAAAAPGIPWSSVLPAPLQVLTRQGLSQHPPAVSAWQRRTMPAHESMACQLDQGAGQDRAKPTPCCSNMAVTSASSLLAALQIPAQIVALWCRLRCSQNPATVHVWWLVRTVQRTVQVRSFTFLPQC
jgi:hypothetical protein